MTPWTLAIVVCASTAVGAFASATVLAIFYTRWLRRLVGEALEVAIHDAEDRILDAMEGVENMAGRASPNVIPLGGLASVKPLDPNLDKE